MLMEQQINPWMYIMDAQVGLKTNALILFLNLFSISFLQLLCVMISHWLTVLKHKMPSQILIKNSWIGLVNVVHLCTPDINMSHRGEGLFTFHPA